QAFPPRYVVRRIDFAISVEVTRQGAGRRKGEIVEVGRCGAESGIQFDYIHATRGHNGVIQYIHAINVEADGSAGPVWRTQLNFSLVPTNAARTDVEPAIHQAVGGSGNPRLIFGVVKAGRVGSSQGKPLQYGAIRRVQVAVARSRVIEEAAGGSGRGSV